MIKRFGCFAPVAIVIALAGCETGGGGGAAGGSAAAGSAVAQGRSLYYGRCTACHAPEPVRDYTHAEWATILPDMAEESNLDPAQTAALRAFIDSQL